MRRVQVPNSHQIWSNSLTRPRQGARKASRSCVMGDAAVASARDIRTATLADAEGIARNNVTMAQESENTTIPPDVSVRGVTACLEDKSKGHYYVIKDDQGAVIAQLMITYEWSDWRAKDIWWIQSVYVAPPHRKQGLFRSLYQHAKAESARAGACGVRLYADNDNEKALKVYEALGMISHYKVYEDLNTDY